ncbi:hypothetical protein Q8F55_004707 [Vanrija albida]|uniref:Ndc10 domain-containing protein n=1 Tax=Vanrija albida TaxID=181172 RepID=A0ABR3Q023_9TREE
MPHGNAAAFIFASSQVAKSQASDDELSGPDLDSCPEDYEERLLEGFYPKRPLTGPTEGIGNIVVTEGLVGSAPLWCQYTKYDGPSTMRVDPHLRLEPRHAQLFWLWYMMRWHFERRGKEAKVLDLMQRLAGHQKLYAEHLVDLSVAKHRAGRDGYVFGALRTLAKPGSAPFAQIAAMYTGTAGLSLRGHEEPPRGYRLKARLREHESNATPQSARLAALCGEDPTYSRFSLQVFRISNSTFKKVAARVIPDLFDPDEANPRWVGSVT